MSTHDITCTPPPDVTPPGCGARANRDALWYFAIASILCLRSAPPATADEEGRLKKRVRAGDPGADLAVFLALEDSCTLNPYAYGNWDLMFNKLLNVYQQDVGNWATLAATSLAVDLVVPVVEPAVPVLHMPEDPVEDVDVDGLNAALAE